MRCVALLIALVALVPLESCSPGYTTTNTGRLISETTVAQLSTGKTDADWVRLVLGEPDERRRGQGAGETWVWSIRRTRRAHQPGADLEWIERTTLVEFTADGRIERAWIEEDRSPGWAD